MRSIQYLKINNTIFFSAVSGYTLEITGRNSHYCGSLAQAFELGIRLYVLLVNIHKPAPVCRALFQAFGEKCQNTLEYVRSEETARHKCGWWREQACIFKGISTGEEGRRAEGSRGFYQGGAACRHHNSFRTPLDAPSRSQTHVCHGRYLFRKVRCFKNASEA